MKNNFNSIKYRTFGFLFLKSVENNINVIIKLNILQTEIEKELITASFSVFPFCNFDHFAKF